MLSSTTCVGLRYGQHVPEVSTAFPGGTSGELSDRSEDLTVLSSSCKEFNVVFRHDASPFLPRPRFTTRAGTGILTRLPSASPLGLSLGPG